MKVYLVYEVFYDNEERTTHDYLQEIYFSIDNAKEMLESLVNDLLLYDDATTHRGIDDEGNIVVYRLDDCEHHFVIEEWTVK